MASTGSFFPPRTGPRLFLPDWNSSPFCMQSSHEEDAAPLHVLCSMMVPTPTFRLCAYLLGAPCSYPPLHRTRGFAVPTPTRPNCSPPFSLFFRQSPRRAVLEDSPPFPRFNLRECLFFPASAKHVYLSVSEPRPTLLDQCPKVLIPFPPTFKTNVVVDL